MKFCQPHWDQLRKTIENSGMGGLIAGSGERAAAALARQLSGAVEKQDFDPLMNSNWAIMSHALKLGGLYLMSADEAGNQYCPLCEAEKHGGPGTASSWIEGCCDAQLQAARELGLIPKIQ